MKPSEWLRLIDLFDEYEYPARVADVLGVSRQALNRRVRKLKKHGVLVKKAYGVWGVRRRKVEKFLRSFKVQEPVVEGHSVLHEEDSVRGHGYAFTLESPVSIERAQSQRVLSSAGIDWKKIGAPTWEGEGFFLNSWRVWITPKGFYAMFDKERSIYDGSAGDCLLEAIHLWKEEVVAPLERLFGRKLHWKKRGESPVYKFRTSAQHHALIKNAYARQLRLEKKKLYVYDDAGTLWLITDYSHNLDELETVKADSSASDMDDAVKPFWNSVKETRVNLHDVLGLFDQTNQLIKANAENHQVHAENIVSHVGAVQDLGLGVRSLNALLQDLGKGVRLLNRKLPEHSRRSGERSKKTVHQTTQSLHRWM